MGLACLLPAMAGELEIALWPLMIPDLPNARQAVTNLTKLAKTQDGAAKARSERLALLIKNLFTAEHQVTAAVKAGNDAENEARQRERNAEEWLKPNLLGRTNEVASQEALTKALQLREKAAKRIADAQQALVDQLREVDSVIEDFNNMQEYEVLLVLVDTSAAVAARSLPKDAFTSAFTPEKVASAREALRLRRGEKTKTPETKEQEKDKDPISQ